MAKIKTIFFCGHESRYGLAHIEPLLKSELFDVREIVLAPFERWNKFYSALTGQLIPGSSAEASKFMRRTHLHEKGIMRLKDLRIRFVFDVNISEEVENAKNYDLAVSAAYPQIFKSALLSALRLGAINFHPSFLPRCRGAHPVYWTIASQESSGGVSCHLMTEDIDAGPIVAQRKVEFDKDSITYDELYRLVVTETPLLCRDVEDFFVFNKQPVPQLGTSSYFKNDREIHRKIFFTGESPERIGAKIRAGRAFAFDRLGRRIQFSPPVTITELPGHLTNNVHTHLADGTVVEASESETVIKVRNRCLKAFYDAVSLDSKSSLLRKAGRILGRSFHSELAIGDVLR